MQMMRAAILESAPGGVHIEEIPMPEPGAGEILVKVSACGVCHTDLHVMKAEVAFPTPAVMGHEISGTVAALGPGVKVRPSEQRSCPRSSCRADSARRAAQDATTCATASSR